MATSLPPGRHSSELKAALDRLARVAALPHLAKVISTLKDSGCFIVGGVVRDSIIGKPIGDIDLTTPANPDKVTALLKAASIYVVPTGLKHGTVTAVIDASHIEITTYRAKASDGSIEFGSNLSEDLLLRDFTINAIAFDPIAQTFVDPADGFSDIHNRLIKAVSNPAQRFSEDPLRILRLVRFGPAAGFMVEQNTERAAKSLVTKLAEISPERIREELKKILLSQNAGDGFRYLAGIGALDFTIPELVPAIGCEQNSWHLYDVFEHTMHVVDNAPSDLVIRLAALFHDVGKPGTLSTGGDGERHFYKHELLSEELCKAAMTRLKFSSNEIEDVALLVALHMRPIECGPPGARRLIRDLGNKFYQWVDLKRADAFGAKHDRVEFEKRMGSFIELTNSERTRLVTNRGRLVVVDGADIMRTLNIPPSPKVGAILKALEERVLDNPELNTKEELLRLAAAMV